MIFFGHLGLTTGAVKIFETVYAIKKKPELPSLDYRFVLLGSILPDLIDKPIGAILFINTYHNSRIYAHTLLFSAFLTLTGVHLYKKRKTNAVLLLGIGSILHILLDSMWRYPETLLWPFLNIKAALWAKSNWLDTLMRFPYRFDNWLETNLSNLFKNPTPLIFELAGLLLLAFFVIRLIRHKQLISFFRTGRL